MMPTPYAALPLAAQLVHVLAAFLLLVAFAMLAQRRILALIHLFACQGLVLTLSTATVAAVSGQDHLYYSAILTLLLKVWILPHVLHRLVVRLHLLRELEALINIPATMLSGLVLVIFAFGLATPISALASTVTKSLIGIALASVLLSFLMMITRRQAVTQVIGFLAMENGLFFAATSTTYGMPMVVELGIALDVLIGAAIMGIFFFHIREAFDSLDLTHLEQLRER
ncbi:MAG: formate hydrogenlyase [Chromatiales bacterium]